MFNKKLKGPDLSELQKRNSLVNQYILIAQALELQKRVWLQGKVKELGLNETKSYEINPKSGEIKELQTPQIKKDELVGSQKNA